MFKRKFVFQILKKQLRKLFEHIKSNSISENHNMYLVLAKRKHYFTTL